LKRARAAVAGWRRFASGSWSTTDWGLALQVFVTNKLIVILVTAAAAWGGPYRVFSTGFAYEVLVRSFRFFDANWYVGIASAGYADLKATAFFPLYPMVIRAVSEILRIAPLTAGVLVSNLAFYGLLWGFVRLARVDLDRAAARRAVWLLGLYPTSFYFSAAYTEALFALLTVLSLYWMRTRQWARAGALGGLAALTRNTGVLLVIPFLIESATSLRDRKRRSGTGARVSPTPPGRRVIFGLLWGGLIGAGAVAYAAFLWWRFGQPFAFVGVQGLYGRESMKPWSTLYHGYGYALQHVLDFGLPPSWSDFYFATQPLFVTLVIVVLIGTMGRIRWSYTALMLYSLVIPLAAPSTEGYVDYFISFSRYSLVILPLYLGLAVLLRRRWLYRGYLAVSVGLLVVLLYAWCNHLWVA